MLAVLKKIDRTLFEMILGIFFYGIVGQVLIIVFSEAIFFVSLGWWIGVMVAVISNIHMWWSLNRALGLDAKSATTLITTQNMLRYVLIVVVMAVVMITEVANPLVAVFGLFGLKAGAYLQPFMHRFMKKR
ncbi:MAG: hypothetical protein R3Y47_00910 [Lachnospiraceae bacterium]